MITLIDIGANLGHRSFERDRAEVIARAKAAGVAVQVVTGTSSAASRAALWLARSHPGVLYSTAGVHPHNAKEWRAGSAGTLHDLALATEVVAVGECGLDFDRDFSPRPKQIECFEAQLALASELKKPVFLHERAASATFAEIMGRWRGRLSRGVVHCFTGNAEELERYLALDLHIGITGWICDERRGKHLLQLVPRIPLDRLMIETDSPFLLPRTLSAKQGRNEPAFLREVLRTVAAARGAPEEEIAAATTKTAAAFFAIPAPA